MIRYIIVSMACGFGATPQPCVVRPLEAGLSYAQTEQCERALRQKETTFLNVAQSGAGPMGEILCVETDGEPNATDGTVASRPTDETQPRRSKRQADDRREFTQFMAEREAAAAQALRAEFERFMAERERASAQTGSSIAR